VKAPKDIIQAGKDLVGTKFCGFLPGDPRTPVTLRIIEVERKGVRVIHDPTLREAFYEWALLGLRIPKVHARKVNYDAVSEAE
jgi:hypothetical protein